MSPLPLTSGREPQDDMIQQIHDRFDRTEAHFDACLDRIERIMLKRSDFYLTLMAAQLISFGVWCVTIWVLRLILS